MSEGTRRLGRTLVVGQSGGATAVINASLIGVVGGALASGAFNRVLGMRHGIEGLLAGDLVDLGSQPSEVLARVRGTPSAALGTGRYKLGDGDLGTALARLGEVDAGALVFIGGNDSADTAHRLHLRAGNEGKPLRVVAVPKTIDNDLPGTDHCPGYGSVARFLANAVRDATYDSLASPQLYAIKIVEVMGRDAGWMSAAGALGFGPDEADLLPLLYLPEHPPASAAAMLEELDGRAGKRGFVVAVVPETLRDADGRHLGGDEPDYVDPHGHPYFPGPGQALVRLIRTRLPHRRARYDKPGTIARMSISLASAVDLAEAEELGRAAAQHAAAGASDVMTSLHREGDGPDSYRCRVTTVPLVEVANQVRTLPPEFIGPDRRSITDAFRHYALPLLGPDPFPIYGRFRHDQPYSGRAE